MSSRRPDSREIESTLAIRPIQLRMLEAVIAGEIADVPTEQQQAVSQQCKQILEEWRARHGACLPTNGTDREDLTLEQLHSASAEVLSAEVDRIPLRNDTDLARTLLSQRHDPLVQLESSVGAVRLLAIIALNDPIVAGRADSLAFVISLLLSTLRQHFDLVKETMPNYMDIAAHNVEEVIAVMGPDVDSMNRQRAARERAAPKGAATNKARGEKVTVVWRQLASDLWDKNPTWSVKEMAQHIHRTHRELEGRNYSETTVRNALKGVRKQWRKVHEERGKRSGLYGLGH